MGGPAFPHRPNAEPGGSHTHDWAEVTGEPAVFPPGAHTHPQADVTGLTTDLAGKAASGHNHDAAYSATGHAHAHTALTGVTADQHHAQAHAVTGADHTASGLTAGHVLRASGAAAFAFAAIQDADLPATIARDGEVSAAVGAHEAAADPHAAYQKEAEKGTANGYAGLGPTGLVPTAQLGGGAASGTVFLAGDQTWKAAGGGSTVDEVVRQMHPLSWHGAANLTTATVFVTNTSYFVYVGRAGKALSTLDVIARVATALATPTWAEVGVFKGTPVANGNATGLTRLGFTNVAATFNSLGVKKTTVPLTGHAAEDDLWLAFGSQATTPYQLRGGLADDLQSGGFQQVAGRISTLAPSTGTLAAATLAQPMARAHFS